MSRSNRANHLCIVPVSNVRSKGAILGFRKYIDMSAIMGDLEPMLRVGGSLKAQLLCTEHYI